ncbi:MAG: DUF4252 domain-containing protein [Terriglobia bacterium]
MSILGNNSRRWSLPSRVTILVAGCLLPLMGPRAARAQDPAVQMNVGFDATSGCGMAAAQAQGGKIQMDELQRLAAKAQNVTNVALDQGMLQLASGFMAKGKSANSAQVRHLLGQLKGVYVKDFEFAHEGAYTQRDVDQILCQVQGHAWKQVVSSVSKEDRETDAIYVLHDGNSFKGILIVSAEPKELAVVNIVGSIDPSELGRLHGMFGIPDRKFGPPKPPAPPEPSR